MIIKSAFTPAWWLTNAHAQTCFATLTRRGVPPIDTMERLELPDGDFIDLAWARNGLDDNTPLVVFLHGLGGSVHSTYVAGQMQAYNANGWRCVLMHFRGASHEPNRLPRAYHSGDTGDLGFLLDVLTQREPHTKKAAVGISLGGNVLLKWLGENASQCMVHTAAAVSVPFQLRTVADRVNQGFSRFYQSYLLGRMRRIFKHKMERYSDVLNMSEQELDSLKCFWTFDERVTAPVHGFPHVHAYYRAASSRQYLANITTPTLIIHALDDPFMTPEALPTEKELSSSITLELAHKGGHVGFIAGSVPGKAQYWLDHRIPEFLQSYLGINCRLSCSAISSDCS
jgi:predicted alpha/beta-fold hydrolase